MIDKRNSKREGQGAVSSPDPSSGSAGGPVVEPPQAPNNGGEPVSNKEPKANIEPAPDPTPQPPTNNPPPGNGGASTAKPVASLTAGWLSYKALANVADQIADVVASQVAGKTLLLSIGEKDMDDLRAWRDFESIVHSAEMAVAGLEQSAPPVPEMAATTVAAGVTAAVGMITSVSSLLDSFKTKVTPSEHSMSLDPHALIASVAGALLRHEHKPGPIKTTQSLALGRDNQLLAEQVEKLAKLLVAARHILGTRSDSDLDRPKVEALIATLELLIQQVMDTSGQGALSKGARMAECLDDGAVMLNVKPVLSGGDQLCIERRLWPNQIYVNGVCAVSFMLLDKSGSLLGADTHRAHTGYRQYGEMGEEFWSKTL